MKKIIIFFTFYIFFFFSCSSLKVTKKEDILKLYIKDNQTIESYNNWWKKFNDKNLTKIISESIANNTDLKIAEKNIKIARINYKIQKSYLFPEINLSGTALRYKKYLTGLPKFIPSKIKESQFNLDFDLSYEIDFWQKNIRSTESKKYLINIEKYNREILKNSLISTVSSIYFEIKKDINKAIILKKILNLYKTEKYILEEKFKKGIIPYNILNEIDIKINSIKEKLPLVYSSIKSLKYSLNILRGKLPLTEIKIEKTWNFKLLKIPNYIPSKVILNRPDINIAIENIFLNKQLVYIAKTNLFPSFYLTGKYGYESNKLSFLISNSTSLWNIAIKFVQSVFDYGKRYNLIKISKINLEKSQLELYKTLLNSLKEIHEYFYHLKKLQENRKEILNNINNLQKKLKNLELKFNINGISFEELIKVKIDILLKKIDLIEAENKIINTQIKLFKAMGF